jgi:hypothetical protein
MNRLPPVSLASRSQVSQASEPDGTTTCSKTASVSISGWASWRAVAKSPLL